MNSLTKGIFIIHCPNAHLSSNIPSTISSGSIFSELLRIVRCSVRNDHFIPRSSDLLSRIIVQGGNRAALTKQRQKTFHHCPDVFQKFGITHDEINTSITKNRK